MSLNCDKCSCVDLCQSFINTNGCLLEESKETKEKFLNEKISQIRKDKKYSLADIAYIKRIATELNLKCDIVETKEDLHISVYGNEEKLLVPIEVLSKIENLINEEFNKLGIELELYTFNKKEDKVRIEVKGDNKTIFVEYK